MKRLLLALWPVLLSPALAQTGAEDTARQLEAGRSAALKPWRAA